MKNIPVINEIEINLDIVKKKLDALLINKSSGPGGLSARVLKEMSDVIAVPVYITSRPFLKNGGRYCFGVSRHICRLRRLRGCFALYLGCY